MKLIPAAHELISNMRAFFQVNKVSPGYSDEEPLRAELYSFDQMERLGKTMASKHKLSARKAKDQLLERLADNENVLQGLRRLLTESIKRKREITPAGEWLLDNFYLVEEQIRIAKTHFPKKYSEGLPQLEDKTFAGQARIYDIVLQFIAHSDGRVDMENLSRFINAYQTTVYLNLGELWAIPIMLRLALIENIRRVSARIGIDKVDRNLADYWASQMVEMAEHNPDHLILEIAEMVKSRPPMESAFVSELIRQLRGRGPDLALVLDWIEHQLSRIGFNITELVNIENQKQAADQVSISNSINSLRLLGIMDWRDFVERHSIVEQTLREDIGNIYSSMDFPTRDRYRHVVELISKKSNTNELEVARIAIQLMLENSTGKDKEEREAHVGYYLIDKGVLQTQRLAKMPVSVMDKLQHMARNSAFPIYVSSILLLTLTITASILLSPYITFKNGWHFFVIALLLTLCASQLALSVVNFIATLIVKPCLLPKMDFSKGIPPQSRTMIVIPALLTSTEVIENLVNALEVRYLANRDNNLHFGLLTDFADASQEVLPEDRSLLDLVQKGIQGLNQKYQRANNDLFFLFHRPRQWNRQEGVWMGYERKRGKLSDLNLLLRENVKDRFSLIVGDQSIFPEVKYVITLDADTQLPFNAARKLVGAMAHPLNRAVYNNRKKRVTRGYGILQPRVTVSLPEFSSSRYRRMHGNEPGIDPYTHASSDVYQDLFAEGSFIGKGIYDVDIFHQVLNGRFLENRILSHDLLEGCYIRSGLLSDVQLFEQYPATYKADMKTRLRWVRGDWQIFSWFLPWVQDIKKRWVPNPLSGLSRWKIFDNIRRSLVPAALTLLLLSGWMVLPHPLFWTIAVSGIIVFPVFVTSLWDIIRKPRDVILKYHFKNSIRNLGDTIVKTLFGLICLPYEAFAILSVIILTLWRVLVSKRKLLEWTPSSSPGYCNPLSLMASYMYMWIEPAFALAASTLLVMYYPDHLVIAEPILLLWLVAPFITWFTSKPSESSISQLTSEQNIFLHKLARKTWNFFEHFITVESNWLPPDNFQEQPVEELAYRTSPTNIGLSLLSNLTAWDFGYITISRLLERTAKTIGTMKKMERYKGHFYNWYDTGSLSPLLPKYISTVDSGNLAAHLLVMKQGLLTLPKQAIVGLQLFAGLRDTLLVLRDTLEESGAELFNDFAGKLEAICLAPMPSGFEIKERTDSLAADFDSLAEKLDCDPDSETCWWTQILKKQLEQLKGQIELLNPWLLLASAPAKFADLFPLDTPATLIELINAAPELNAKIRSLQNVNHSPDEAAWLASLQVTLSVSIQTAHELVYSAETLATQCRELADMEWDFLYDKSSHLLSIGYNVQEHLVDASYYDLLSSEVRLCVFTCIALGKLPEESWFALGRLLTNVDGSPILLSWSGSMFEYLMPLLVMPTYDNTLLDQTNKAAVAWQIKYSKERGLPWGVSESCYNMINANSIYQYRAFGVKGLGLKRGLDEDAVIAPYASALALMISPRKACENLELLTQKGLQGRFGMYEAIDYTPSRLQRDQSSAIVYSFMAHHHGMSLLSLAYLLRDKPMQKLFEAEPEFKATLLLLQERLPRATAFFAHTTDIAEINSTIGGVETRIIKTPDTPTPEVQLLSNGRYHVMITNAGGSYSRWKDIAVTRWREDSTRDNWGTFCYIRDVESETYWSNTYQPTLKKGETYEAVFSQGRADFHNVHEEIEVRTEIVVSPEDDIEMRSVLITNSSGNSKTIEVTSYAEVVLAPAASDLIQPAFSNLFVQTEILPEQQAILCTRRPRSATEQMPWMFHLMTMGEKKPEAVSYETDRMNFIGRGNTPRNPGAMAQPGLLSGSQGSVLDPIVAIRYKIKLEPEEKIKIDIVTGIAETKEHCRYLVSKYQDSKAYKNRVFEMAWTHSQVLLRQINASEADAQLYGSLASAILFTNALFRADPVILANNRRQQSGLWGYSISGDLPIVLLKVRKQVNMQLVRQLIQAHTYWRLKGLTVDLVIWNEEHSDYRQIFQFQTVARMIISDDNGTLADHVKRKTIGKKAIPYIKQEQSYNPAPASLDTPGDLLFFNGFGGFSSDGKEYVIVVNNKNKTPAPWVNVIANPVFGTVISESGSAYTWTENAHELRITPWNNDAVGDQGGEAFYLRDEETGHFWSPALLPAGGPSSYITRHGFGYSIFEHIEDDIYSEMTVYTDIEKAVKFTVIKIRNQSGRPRRLSVTGYAEWVLGDNRAKTAMHIQTEINPESGALFAKNPYNTEFSQRVAFFDVDDLNKTFTTDRTEFIGRNGSLQHPDALLRMHLSGKLGPALDPCAAIQVPFSLPEGGEREIIFRLGVGKDSNDATTVAREAKGSLAAMDALAKVKRYWQQMLGSLQVTTPDVAINILTNGWLTYQTLSSRLWGRSGFYQSGGAFGFRDQLQDVLSLLHIAPQLARAQILLCASRQFKEGDVQHWWHPPAGRGVRTRISDDYLWLPFVTSIYVGHTGDYIILKEPVPLLDGRLLNPGEESYFDLPLQSNASVSLYDHCVLAVKHGLNYGEHGLPLIGTGDWNDGLDKVGHHGKGESVWLGFFLYDILTRFTTIAQLCNDEVFAATCRDEALRLRSNLDQYTWDGEWYKRAWFDNGTELGTSSNDECRIDSIAQSWSVLSGAGDSGKVALAMESAYKYLVRKDARIIQLLEPAFDKSALNPGYIKGYVPGVRENGGQYTHAAIWMIMAFARLGDSERVWELLNMINPVNHGSTTEEIAVYKVEPYVMAADVYSRASHAGRGGWTWYTGAAGWMYQLIITSFLGLQCEEEKLRITPCIPRSWKSFEINYRYKDTVYHIEVRQTDNREDTILTVDGKQQESSIIILIDDRMEHNVLLVVLAGNKD